MSGTEKKKYWRSWEDRNGGSPEDRPARPGEIDLSQFSRRGFLETSGFALFLSALAGCSRQSARTALMPVKQAAGAVPGKANHYASVCQACPAGCGMLVKCRDGRPIKLEGNPDHPLSRGGLCAVGQASVLELYDSLRLSAPLIGGEPVDWKRVDREVTAALGKIRQSGGAIRFLTGTTTSPTRRAMIERFLQDFADARHVVYDPLSGSAILAAHQRTHGIAVLPHYRLDQAEVIASFDADFLGTWISPVEYAAAYQAGRVPSEQSAAMAYHVQFEPRMSLTGSKADRRECVRPEEIGLIMSHLATRIAKKAGAKGVGSLFPSRAEGLPETLKPLAETEKDSRPLLDELAERLWQAKGKSLVLCGSQDESAQTVCNLLNELLGAYGKTIDIERPSLQRQGRSSQLAELVEEIRGGKISALFIADVNPVYDLPGGAALAEAIRKIPLVVSFANTADETAETARYVCPEGHPLETWGDAEPVGGLVSVCQPTIRPLGKTRSLPASLASWMGSPRSDLQIVRDHWKTHIYPRAADQAAFPAFWDRVLHDGFVEVKHESPQAKPFDMAAAKLETSAPEANNESFSLVLYPKVGMLDGRHAHNPWLQELPDPITKATWDNYACLSPATAARLGLGDGDVVRITVGAGEGEAASIDLPALVQPGQHDQVVAVAIGYGSKATERFAGIGPQWIKGRSSLGPNGRVGTSVAPLAAGSRVTLAATGEHHPLACTQRHHEITVPKHLATPGTERRPVIEETTLAAFHQDPHSGAHAHHHFDGDLWVDDHAYRGHHWALAIDLSKCTGCSACVIACQAENNVPLVGKDEVRRSREMHWIRIDRYYSENGEGGVDVAHQPMMCHHCDNAPCETVCPVLATAHSSEGLNQQVYNRCVGTRYCANNCPYKVRRFNWFEYAREDKLQNAALNPDITVRSRGVMEKCSLCVQRIQEAKIEAKRQGQPVPDGAIQPACQQSCPAKAIVFGDLNNPESEVSKLVAGPRTYQVLSELNVRPAVHYLRLVRNRQANETESAHV